MVETSTDLRDAVSRLHPAAILISCVGGFVTLFVMMNVFAIANSPLLTKVEMLIVSPLIAGLVGLSLYVLSAGRMGHRGLHKWMPLAAVLPSLMISLTAGLHLSLIAHGQNGPWREAYEGMSGPMADGFLSGAYWPITFTLGAGLSAALCYWATITFTPKATPTEDDDFDGSDLADLSVMGGD